MLQPIFVIKHAKKTSQTSQKRYKMPVSQRLKVRVFLYLIEPLRTLAWAYALINQSTAIDSSQANSLGVLSSVLWEAEMSFDQGKHVNERHSKSTNRKASRCSSQCLFVVYVCERLGSNPFAVPLS